MTTRRRRRKRRRTSKRQTESSCCTSLSSSLLFLFIALLFSGGDGSPRHLYSILHPSRIALRLRTRFRGGVRPFCSFFFLFLLSSPHAAHSSLRMGGTLTPSLPSRPSLSFIHRFSISTLSSPSQQLARRGLAGAFFGRDFFGVRVTAVVERSFCCSQWPPPASEPYSPRRWFVVCFRGLCVLCVQRAPLGQGASRVERWSSGVRRRRPQRTAAVPVPSAPLHPSHSSVSLLTRKARRDSNGRGSILRERKTVHRGATGGSGRGQQQQQQQQQQRQTPVGSVPLAVRLDTGLAGHCLPDRRAEPSA